MTKDTDNGFLDDPAVTAALDALENAVKAAVKAGGGTNRVKAVAVVVKTRKSIGSAVSGCTCAGCSVAMITELTEALGGVVDVNDITGENRAQVH